VNNAGVGFLHDTLTISQEDIQKLFAVNVYGTINLVKTVVPQMPSGGRIINISSIAAKMGPGSMPVYGATKAALDALTFSWAQEVSKPLLRQRLIFL
jgi:NAD(P)-dependent dehydrogenase (short-subunit alcohol dehydrogenase family)